MSAASLSIALRLLCFPLHRCGSTLVPYCIPQLLARAESCPNNASPLILTSVVIIICLWPVFPSSFVTFSVYVSIFTQVHEPGPRCDGRFFYSTPQATSALLGNGQAPGGVSRDPGTQRAVWMGLPYLSRFWRCGCGAERRL